MIVCAIVFIVIFLRRFIRSVMYIVCNEVEGVLAASRWGGGGGGGGG